VRVVIAQEGCLVDVGQPRALDISGAQPGERAQ